MLVTTDWLKEHYIKFNEQYWNGELPNDIEFKISRSSKTWGYASYRFNIREGWFKPTSITLSNYYDSPEKVKLNTLLHEMVHIADYTFHPEHFVRNGRKVRGYDAHGYVFFLKEAERLNKDGWDIQKFVQQWEHDESEISSHEQELINRKVKNGVTVYVMEYKNPCRAKQGGLYPYGYCRLGSNEYKYRSIIERDNQKFKWVKKYVSYSPEIMNMKASKGGSWFLTNDIQKLFDKYELVHVENIITNDGYEDYYPVKKTENKEENNKGPKRISLFRSPLVGGETFELRNFTGNELYQALKERFPKFSEKQITNIVNNIKFYPNGLNENKNMKMTIKENQIRKIVRKVLKEIIDGNFEDPMVHTQRINNEEEIVSIE